MLILSSTCLMVGPSRVETEAMTVTAVTVTDVTATEVIVAAATVTDVTVIVVPVTTATVTFMTKTPPSLVPGYSTKNKSDPGTPEVSPTEYTLWQGGLPPASSQHLGYSSERPRTPLHGSVSHSELDLNGSVSHSKPDLKKRLCWRSVTNDVTPWRCLSRKKK